MDDYACGTAVLRDSAARTADANTFPADRVVITYKTQFNTQVHRLPETRILAYRAIPRAMGRVYGQIRKAEPTHPRPLQDQTRSSGGAHIAATEPS